MIISRPSKDPILQPPKLVLDAQDELACRAAQFYAYLKHQSLNVEEARAAQAIADLMVTWHKDHVSEGACA